MSGIILVTEQIKSYNVESIVVQKPFLQLGSPWLSISWIGAISADTKPSCAVVKTNISIFSTTIVVDEKCNKLIQWALSCRSDTMVQVES